MPKICVIVISIVFFLSTQTHGRADLIQFELTGAGGSGLLEGNIDPPTGEAGTGGIGAMGITFDSMDNTLHIHVEWGSAFGFTDLSQDVFRLHLHGPTADAAPDSFGQTAPLLINLSNSSTFVALSTGGGVNDGFFLENQNVGDLMEGRLYINVHLNDGDTGVIRGYLVQVIPEPASCLVVLASLMTACSFRRRTRKQIWMSRKSISSW